MYTCQYEFEYFNFVKQNLTASTYQNKPTFKNRPKFKEKPENQC